MLTGNEISNCEGKIVKMPAILGAIGTGLTFALKYVSEITGAVAGILTCTYLIVQIYFKLKHERQFKAKTKKHHD